MVCTMRLDNYTRVSVSKPQITHFSVFLAYIVSNPHKLCIYAGRASGLLVANPTYIHPTPRHC